MNLTPNQFNKLNDLNDALKARDFHAAEAERLRLELLRELSPGRYGKWTIYRVKKQKIEVRAYTRHAYTSIRRNTTV